jgi:hypothetical protein
MFQINLTNLQGNIMARKLTKITHIEYTETTGHVYDIEVNHPSHAFYAESENGAVGISHNSALISLSNLSDDRMRAAKSGQWWIENSNFAFANNSVAYTEKPDMGIFMKEWMALYESKSGERGIFNRDGAKRHLKKFGLRDLNHEFGVNPCGEVILRSSGFCNLSTIIVRPNDTYESFMTKAKYAAIAGTLQSTLTNFRFLSKEWKKNCDEERLLGVSISGIMDHPFLSGKQKTIVDDSGNEIVLSEFLNRLRDHIFDVNKTYAEKLGVNPSVSVTAEKPEGCCFWDTPIRTNLGIIPLNSIFELNGYIEPQINNLPEKTFLPVTTLLSVFDENNELTPVTELYVMVLLKFMKLNLKMDLWSS